MPTLRPPGRDVDPWYRQLWPDLAAVIEAASGDLVGRSDTATTAIAGVVKQSAAVTDIDQTISATPTQAEVQALSDKLDELLAAQRASGQMET